MVASFPSTKHRARCSSVLSRRNGSSVAGTKLSVRSPIGVWPGGALREVAS
jgi:hypothetical protein